jgi:hypothetical protein
MEQQTAVEYLFNEISDILGRIETTPMQDLLMIDVVNKSKEMEKEQIVNSWDLSRRDIDYPANGEQYYNETYKNK